jgi:hypothetical protein
MLYEADYAREVNQSADQHEMYPGHFVFGSNGGLETIAFDTRAKPPWPVVMYDPIAGTESAVTIAKNMEEFIRAIGIDDQDYFGEFVVPDPTIKALGVYSLPFNEQMLKEQTDILWGTDLKGAARRKAERRCREQLASTVLIETLVQDRDDRFSARDFCQPKIGIRPDSWQAAWLVACLSVDGKSLLETVSVKSVWPDLPADKNFRVAFFIHFWDPKSPLLTSYGEIKCPPVKKMPVRLQRLVPYELLD